MRSQHPAKHNEISTAAERFCHVTRNSTAAVADNLSAQTVSSISTFDNSRKLRISHAGFYASRTYRSRADADFYNIRARKNKFFHHFTGHHVACTNDFIGASFAYTLQETHKVLGITISDIQANKLQQRRQSKNLQGFNEISF